MLRHEEKCENSKCKENEWDTLKVIEVEYFGLTQDDFYNSDTSVESGDSNESDRERETTSGESGGSSVSDESGSEFASISEESLEVEYIGPTDDEVNKLENSYNSNSANHDNDDSHLGADLGSDNSEHDTSAVRPESRNPNAHNDSSPQAKVIDVEYIGDTDDEVNKLENAMDPYGGNSSVRPGSNFRGNKKRRVT